ncbi:hypothetical protein evm_009358 [Chilo suppressalis]|nr:hypothetical protein evm_009358 [Chilo suppressalis]
MTDSDSFTSLMALVDNHLSKTTLQTSNTVDNRFPRLNLPTLTGGPNETVSETRLSMSPGQRLPFPTLSLTDSPIQEVLAQQVNNMLIAKERKKKQEEELAQLALQRQKLAEDAKRLKDENEDDCVIDLVKAVQESMNFKSPSPVTHKDEQLSSSSSFESLFEPKFIDCDGEPENVLTPEPLLPCKTDMLYILKQKFRRGKCSPFAQNHLVIS